MKYILIFCFQLLTLIVKSQEPIISPADQLRDAVTELQNNDLLKNGLVTISVQKVNDGTVLLGHQAGLSVPSASTLKLVSTATALSVLGGDYKYETFLEYDGEIKNKVLKGNLYIRGTGDPTLGSDRFKETHLSASQLIDRWTSLVKELGILKIEGAVIADASWFDEFTLADSWPWGDLGNYYGAGVSGLNFADNQYTVFFHAGGSVGSPAGLTEVPSAVSYLNITNKVKTGIRGSGDQVNIYGNPLSRDVILTGTVPLGARKFPVKGALPRGDFHAAHLLKQNLEKIGIKVSADVRVLNQLPTDNIKRQLLDKYESPVLKEIARETNWYSVNLYADALFKSAAKQLGSEPDFDSCVKTIKAYWESKGVNMDGFFVKDGSGLSPSGSMTGLNLTGILNAMSKDKEFNAFFDGIAIAGMHGTVRNIGKASRAAGLMRIKSGSIDGTRAYAGYITGKAGELLSFSITTQKYTPGSSRDAGAELNKLLGLIAEL